VVIWWKGLGQVAGDGLFGGFSAWWNVRLLLKMVNKTNAIEYSGGTGEF
jgi:hypothetical protein